ERLLALQKLQADIQLGNNRRLIGRDIRVLIVSGNGKKNNEVIGRSESYRVVHFPSTAAIGSFAMVTITGAGPHSLRGEQNPAAG
ncbi:MAG TPA: TRAM domain-containing protein, partial [Candidatus Binatia bacterium]|nr:TRAM domain-containing protein [Candidatus Binatia bacterium]